jgi:hypothetical protein
LPKKGDNIVKTLSILLALTALAFTQLADASAVATSVAGTVRVQSGQAAPRILRQGDEVVQGDTISTGPNSSVVLKFDDGQVTALTGNSRMQVTAYEYNPQAHTGNMLLSLFVGGMRAITGLIGHAQPDKVKYRVATATIGIRGSEGIMVTDGTNVVLTVITGEFVFTFQGKRVRVPAGEGVSATAAGQLSLATAQRILDGLPQNFRDAIQDAQALQNAINSARPGQPRAIIPGQQGQQGQQGFQNSGQGPQGNGPGGGGGSGS